MASTELYASNIKQNIQVSGTTIQNVIGNSDNISSLSTTFNIKNTTSNVAIDCYEIKSVGSQYCCQYCELVIGGANGGPGGYCSKYYFSIFKSVAVSSGQTSITNLTNIINVNGTTTITYSYPDINTITLKILTPVTNEGQYFISTLTAYPTVALYNGTSDFSITAI